MIDFHLSYYLMFTHCPESQVNMCDLQFDRVSVFAIPRLEFQTCLPIGRLNLLSNCKVNISLGLLIDLIVHWLVVLST